MSEDTAVSLLEGALTDDEARRARSHAEACGDCRRVLAALVSDVPSALSAGAQVGRYRIEGRLGAGGMGVVYQAYDPELQRRVALKLVRPHESDDEAAQQRLLEEARRAARLSHPNVVAVHDAGTFEGQVFLTMELAPGHTLDEWRREKARTWREVVEVLRQAARGLAAAHAAGLIHRDFKPSNVLVGQDGRVRVLDFGIAEPVDGSRAGAAGTPRYMAPEQRQGRAGFASDQYAFGLVLGEALGRHRPAFLDAVVARATRHDPADRYPDMGALLRDLQRDPAVRRRRWLLAGAALLVLGAAGVAGARLAGSGAGVCLDDERMDDLWNEDSRGALRRAFLGTGASFAPDAWQRLESGLDRYAARWKRTRRGSCAAGAEGTLSERALLQRMSCLERGREELAALLDELRRADAALVARAPEAMLSLGDPAGCEEPERTERPRPSDAMARARVMEIEARLRRAGALRRLGRYELGLEEARAAAREAAQLGFRPSEAEAYYLAGVLSKLVGEAETAEADLQRALWAAEAAGFDELAVRAWIDLIQVVGVQRGDPERAEAWLPRAFAALERVGRPRGPDAELAGVVGQLDTVRGRLAEAAAGFERALEMDGGRALDPAARAALHATYGAVLATQGRLDEALLQQRKALVIYREQFGEGHPQTALVLYNLGVLSGQRGEHATAVSYLERALALRDTAGASPREIGDTCFALARARWATGGDSVADAVEGLVERARKSFVAAEQAGRAKAVVDWWAARRPFQ